MKKRQLILTSSIAIVAIVIVGILLVMRQQHASEEATVPLVDQTALKSLPSRDGSTADTSHVAQSITPPTNSWLSGMVLQKVPEPVYPMPLSFRAQETGFEIGLPAIAVSPTVISGGHTAGVAASIAQATHFQLTRYDKLSASLTYKNEQGSDIGRLTLAQGSPYIYYRAVSDGELTLNDIVPAHDSSTSAHYLRYKKAGHDYVVATSDNATITTNNTTGHIQIRKDSLVTFYTLPGDGEDTLRPYAANELTSVTTSHHTAGRAVDTTLRYETATHQPTVFAPMGYQTTTQPSQPLTTYDTIYGPMKAVAGNDFTMTVPLSTSADKLDISHLSEQHKQTLIKSLKQDVDNTKITAQDSYYAGKQLARAANLLTLATQLNQPSLADRLSTILKDAFAARLNGDYFYYDSKLKGIAATTKAFGSEDFNDHHFHYGYFIYAAGVLGQYDSNFLSQYKSKINLLVADISSYDASPDFPATRYFDAYAGHSWAAGLAPFADGNNQESSSEAANAWNAVALWGQLTHNTRLAETGTWMFANESATARTVWRQKPTSIPDSSNYTSPLTSLNFGGKRTYSTFFSDAPNAKLGVQLLPMNPYAAHQIDDTKVAKQLVDSSVTNDNFNVALGDYILMYLSLYDKPRALSLVDKQQDGFIDDGNSRTYLNAFVYSQTDR